MNGVEVDCQIASDNVAGARMATEYLIEQIGEGAKAAEIEGVPGASATIDRGAGSMRRRMKRLKSLRASRPTLTVRKG